MESLAGFEPRRAFSSRGDGIMLPRCGRPAFDRLALLMMGDGRDHMDAVEVFVVVRNMRSSIRIT